jgi:hypothetical protein
LTVVVIPPSVVWNVNIGSEVDSSDNFVGAAPENTVNSTWNSVGIPTNQALVTSTGASSSVTLTLGGGANQVVNNPDYAGALDIFETWVKNNTNSVPVAVTFGGLSPTGNKYDLIVYADWKWQTGAGMPITQTVGTGMTGTVTLNTFGGAENTIRPLTQDTDPGNNGGVRGNWIRINGLTPDGSGNLGFNMNGGNAPISGFQLIRQLPSNTFTAWADANGATGQTPGQDHDNDGVENGVEYFMGETGSSFTAMPSLDGSNTIAWTMDPNYQGTYEVQTSPDLGTWTNVVPKPLPSGGTLSYILPPGAPGGKSFVRLLVTPAP